MHATRARAIARAAALRAGVKPPRQRQPRRRYRLRNRLFPKQLALLESTARHKAALCSRRAGKTETAATYLLDAATSYDKVRVVYVALTRRTAKKLLWQRLKDLAKANAIDVTWNNSELIGYLSNGSEIWLTGAADTDDIEKLRGFAFKLAILDECGSFGAHLEELVDDVLEPTLLDEDGTICLLGTPVAACAGLFHEVTGSQKRKGWELHSWTVRDNPHIPHFDRWLTEHMERKGWDTDHPVYLREWCGRWVRDAESLVYKWQQERNSYTELPDEQWHKILGIDLGYDDLTAFVVCHFSPDLPDCYLGDCWGNSGLDTVDIAGVIGDYQERHGAFTSIVADTGGLGKMIVEELNKRHGLSVIPAEKTAKQDFIEHFNGDMRTGRIKIEAGSPYEDEIEILQWDDSKKRRVEDERFSNHFCDAGLYAWRESLHYAHIDPAAPLEGDAALEAEAREIEARIVAEAQRAAAIGDWDTDLDDW